MTPAPSAQLIEDQIAIQRAWDDFRGDWDWNKGELWLPIEEPVSVSYGGAQYMNKARTAVFNLERGKMDGVPAVRIVGRIADAERTVWWAPDPPPAGEK